MADKSGDKSVEMKAPKLEDKLAALMVSLMGCVLAEKLADWSARK